MADESSFIEWFYKGAVAVLFALGSWLCNKMAGAILGLGADVKVLRADLNDHKLDAEKRFAKEDHVNENFNKITGTMNALQNSLNMNTNMTSVIMEKITAINERMKKP